MLNAGISQRDIFENLKFESIQRIMNINFMSNVAITQVCLPYIKKSAGRIGVTSSVQGLIGNPVRTLYSASKHAIQGFFNSLRPEIYANGVSVTLFCPDYVKTNLSQHAVFLIILEIAKKIRGENKQSKKQDKQLEKGMDPMECAYAMVKAVFEREVETWICPFYYKIAVPILRVFPELQAWYLRKRVKQQLETI